MLANKKITAAAVPNSPTDHVTLFIDENGDAKLKNELGSVTDIGPAAAAAAVAAHVAEPNPHEQYAQVTYDDNNRVTGVTSPTGDTVTTAFRYNKIRIAGFGDSRIDYWTNDVSASPSRGLIRSISVGLWAMSASQGRVDFPVELNFGVAGDTTTQMLARLDDVVAADCDAVFILASTNDRKNGITAATSISNLDTIFKALITSGKKLIVVAEMPRGSATFTVNRLTASQLNEHMQVRQWILDQAREANIAVIDPYPIIADPFSATGDIVDQYAYDGLHQSPLGAKVMGGLTAAAVNVLYPPAPFLTATNYELYNATENPRGNLVTNGMFQGTTVATGWTESVPAGVTSSLTCGVDAEGPYQQIVLSGTPSTASPVYELFRNTTSVGDIIANDKLYATGRIDVSAGGSNYIGTYLRHRPVYTTLGQKISGYGFYQTATGTNVTEAHTLYCITPTLQFNDTVTSDRISFIAQLVQSQPVTLTVKLRSFAVRKVIS